MILFTHNHWHLTCISVFVSASCGVAADALFGKKVGLLSDSDQGTINFYQRLGLWISVLAVGVLFVALVQAVPLGSAQLFAHKAQARALMMLCTQFDRIVVLIGMIFSLFLSYIKGNPVMVLGGILMPVNLSLGLITGGFIGYLTKGRARYEHIASGVFAANSLWMVIQALFLS